MTAVNITSQLQTAMVTAPPVAVQSLSISVTLNVTLNSPSVTTVIVIVLLSVTTEGLVTDTNMPEGERRH